ncbi:MAG: radical SAM protein [Bacteroidales bacterium]|jgi:hypothetical protein
MLLKDLNKNAKPVSFANSTYETPHLSLETNLTCNLSCKACYNLNKDYVKSFDQIKSEIDLAATKRNLETITILGGEPTLHPDLPEIIRYIKKKGLLCQLLSNGIKFLQDDKDILLKACIEAGISRVVVHVDEGQIHHHGDIESVIKKLFDKFEAHKFPFALSITVYNVNKMMVSDVITKYMKYQYFDGIIGILERDFAESMLKKPISKDRPELIDVYQGITDKLKIEPSAFLPSSVQDDYITWLVYLFIINKETGVALRVSPTIFQFLRKLVRLRTHKNSVGGFYSRKTLSLAVFILMCLELLTNIKSFSQVRSILKSSASLKNIRLLFITLQNPPEFNAEKNSLQFCYHCPDATIRNGQLTPVCVADFINPIEKETELGKKFSKDKSEVSNLVYEHLNEK